jgi:hypothetical protein
MLPKAMVLLCLGKIGLIHDTMNSTWTCTSVLTAHHNHWIEIIGIVHKVSVTILTTLKVNCIWIRGALFM